MYVCEIVSIIKSKVLWPNNFQNKQCLLGTTVAKRKRSHRQPRKQNEGIAAHDQEAEATCITKFRCMVPVDCDLAFP